MLRSSRCVLQPDPVPQGNHGATRRHEKTGSCPRTDCRFFIAHGSARFGLPVPRFAALFFQELETLDYHAAVTCLAHVVDGEQGGAGGGEGFHFHPCAPDTLAGGFDPDTVLACVQFKGDGDTRQGDGVAQWNQVCRAFCALDAGDARNTEHIAFGSLAGLDQGEGFRRHADAATGAGDAQGFGFLSDIHHMRLAGLIEMGEGRELRAGYWGVVHESEFRYGLMQSVARRLPVAPCGWAIIAPMKTAQPTLLPRRKRIVALLLAASLSAPAWPQAGLPELGDTAGSELSLQTEKRIGQEIMNEIRLREPSYMDDPEVEAYLNQLGNRLVAASPDPGLGFYFFPLQDPMINAFAMFGGYIGVNSGLILAVQNESELAGVLAHEISHVTQRHLARIIEKQKQISTASLLAMAAALLAARSNADMAGAALASASAGAAQAQLGFSRDFEREADRVGFQILDRAGFDVRGMAAFFARLQRATRVYENNAPVYLRTHPLNIERISDMQNREMGSPYRQVPDSFEFHLVRARLQAMRGTPAEAVAHFRRLLQEQKTLNVGASRYGLAVALARQKDWAEVERVLQELRGGKPASAAMIERLYAQARVNRGDVAGGLGAFREALARFPNSAALVYGLADALLSQGRLEEAQAFLAAQVQKNAFDARLYQLQAQTFARQGRPAQQHKALAEAYVLQGRLAAAVEQLELAQKARGADFYEQSAIDARLRVLKRRQLDEARRN